MFQLLAFHVTSCHIYDVTTVDPLSLHRIGRATPARLKQEGVSAGSRHSVQETICQIRFELPSGASGKTGLKWPSPRERVLLGREQPITTSSPLGEREGWRKPNRKTR